MNKSDYTKLGLYDHNIKSYEKIKKAFESGQKIAGIVHATGTGKTYNALQLAYDNKDKKTLFLVPSNSIKEHIIKTIEDNPNLDFAKDFKNLEFMTYQSLSRMNDEELSQLDYDYLVIDEFHHIGAPIWGPKVNKLIKLNPDKYVLGMTAYTVRDRGTEFERDMANPETEELFSNKLVSTYDLVDAMIDGILPKPIYRSAYINLIGFVNDVEQKLEKVKIDKETYKNCKKVIEEIKKRIHNAPSIEEVFRKNIKPDGKYIYFCPPGGFDGINDIDTIMKQTREYLEKCFPDIDFVFYKTTSKDGKIGNQNRESFYNDILLDGTTVKGKLRIMFAINQYNEGVHAPNIDGVIMGRCTKSDIVFFEQLGRALSVREDIKSLRTELKEYEKEELMIIAFRKGLDVTIDMSNEEIIEILLSPIVIDLTNNFDYIKELENNLKDRVKEAREKTFPGAKRKIKITNTTFDIDIINQDLFEMLKKLRNKLAPMTWDAYYELAKAYYNHYGNLKIKEYFKTFNGITYDENGINLYAWVMRQKGLYKKGKLDKDKMDKLDAIGATPQTLTTKRLTWNESYELASIYYNYHGNLHVPKGFKTKNGYEYNEDGYNLYNWLGYQIHLNASLYGALIRLEYNRFYDKVDKNRNARDIETLKSQIDKLSKIGYSGFLEYKKKNKSKRRKREQ